MRTGARLEASPLPGALRIEDTRHDLGERSVHAAVSGREPQAPTLSQLEAQKHVGRKSGELDPEVVVG